jgi:hypothetical protein
MRRHYQVMLSTSIRSARRVSGHGEEVSGSLLIGKLDIGEQTFTVSRQLELPESPHLPGRRSVRGVARFAGGIAACNTSQLFLLDEETNRVRCIYSERRFGDLHSICPRNGTLYLTATASDCIIGVDQNFRKVSEWWAGSEKALKLYIRDWQRQRISTDHDFRGDLNPGARFHMNHVCFDDRGNMLVTLPGMSYREGKSRVYNVTRHEFLFGGRPIPGATRGRVHDGIALGSFYYLCRTASGDFIKLERETGQVVGCVNCSTPLETTTGDPLALEHGWLRGASHLDGEVFLVGQAKLRLFLVDMNSETRSQPLRVIGADGDQEDPGLAIYCIAKVTP